MGLFHPTLYELIGDPPCHISFYYNSWLIRDPYHVFFEKKSLQNCVVCHVIPNITANNQGHQLVTSSAEWTEVMTHGIA